MCTWCRPIPNAACRGLVGLLNPFPDSAGMVTVYGAILFESMIAGRVDGSCATLEGCESRCSAGGGGGVPEIKHLEPFSGYRSSRFSEQYVRVCVCH